MLGPGARGPSTQERGPPGETEAKAQSSGPHTRERDRPGEHHTQGSSTVFIPHLHEGLRQPRRSLP